MPPSPQESPHRSARASVAEESKDDEEKRRSIYGELSRYLAELKSSSAGRPLSSCPGSSGSSSSVPQVDNSAGGEGGEGTGITAVDIPSNFDEVVSCMSRADLEFGVDGQAARHDETYQQKGRAKGSGQLLSVEAATASPFSQGPPTESSIDWSKYALSEGISKLGIYYQYEEELKRDQSERERIEKAMAKVQLLDRKLSVKEVEHDARIAEYAKEVDDLQKEIAMYEGEYHDLHGVAPPGHRLKSSPGKGRQQDYQNGPEDHSYGSGPPSSRGSTGSSRFFLTDKLRKATPRSAGKFLRSPRSQMGKLVSLLFFSVGGRKYKETAMRSIRKAHQRKLNKT